MTKRFRTCPTFLLASLLLSTGASIFAQPTAEPSALIEEVSTKLQSATKALEGFDRIRASVTDRTPTAIDYSSVKNKDRTVADVLAVANDPTAKTTDITVSYSIVYMRGANGTERVEMSPIVRAETRDGEIQKAVISPATVSFINEAGERFRGVHNYMFMIDTGDAGISERLLRDRKPESHLTPFNQSNRFGPDYVYSTRTIPLEAYLARELSLASTASREVDTDGNTVYTFETVNEAGKVDHQVTFKKFGEELLPLSYSISANGKVTEQQLWEYQLQDTQWVPQTSTLTTESAIDGVDTTEVMTFEFEKGAPLEVAQTQEFFSIDEEMKPLFDEGRSIYMAEVSQRRDIEVSGDLTILP